VHPIYPDCRSVIRMVRIGGTSKEELLAELVRNGVELNESAQALFAHDMFRTTEVSSFLETVEISVARLGYAQGATIANLYKRAVELGLSLCPLELGPHFRLQFFDQPEGDVGYPPSRHRAPPGSITVASQPLAKDDEIPKGFYLRRIKGVLWLRGYRSTPEHVWSPEDHFVFCRPDNTV
jgi:hypothetical protein